MRIRPYGPDDVPQLCQLFHRAVREGAAEHYEPEQLAAWSPALPEPEPWAARMAESALTLVAEGDGGALLGFLELTPDAHIHMLFRDPAANGMGVAAALLDGAEEFAGEQGWTRLTTHASVTAEPFFERHGFMVIRRKEVSLEGQSLENAAMVKSL